MVPDRRRYSRQQIVNSLVYADLGPSNGGILVDLSEGGLAVQLASPVTSNRFIHLGFSLPGTRNRIEADCQIAWIDESNRRAGVRFMDLPEGSHQQIREWLSVRALSGSSAEATTTPLEVERNQLESSSASPDIVQNRELDYGPPMDLQAALSQPQRISEPKQGEQATVEQEGRDRGSGATILGTRRFVGLCVGAVALSGLTFVLGYMLGRGESSSRSGAAPSADTETLRPSGVQSAPAKPSGATAGDSTLSAPLIPQGAIVLQVAALTRESDARAMAEALRKKKLPAFVLKPSADQYYRVQVGPYSDTESAHIARRMLENAGFKPIVKRS